jgi:ribose transport system ATP-binding protein
VVATLALEVRDLSKRYGPVLALDDVSIEVAAGTVHALVGANGSGKSTLIKVLAGVERAEPGASAFVHGRPLAIHHPDPAAAAAVGVRVVHQGSTVFPELTVAENVALGGDLPTRSGGSIRWAEANRRAAAALARLGVQVSPRARVGELSAAVQTLVAVARALGDVVPDVESPRLVVLDEPTAALPAREVELLLGGLRRLADEGHAVLLVTHRLDEVASAADVATVLRDGRVVGTFAVGSVPPAEVVAMITGTSAVADEPADHEPAARPPGSAPLLEVHDLVVDGLDGVSLEVQEGEVVGVAGLLGSGRSTLLEALFGARRRRRGQVLLDGTPLDLRSPSRAMRAGVALVPEQREQAVFIGQSLAENLSIADLPRWQRRGRLDRAAERRAAAEDVAAFGIVASSPRAPMATLSGGNQQKVVLARWLRRSPRLLLLDEPTLGVDVGARAEIHGLVRRAAAERGAGVLFVSSDVEELCALTDRVLVLHGGRVAHELHADQATPGALDQLVHQEVLA